MDKEVRKQVERGGHFQEQGMKRNVVRIARHLGDTDTMGERRDLERGRRERKYEYDQF